MKFSEFGLHEQLLEGLSYMGFETATPVQEQAIPAILDNKDVLACAQTGTGKTAAFILPVINAMAHNPSKTTNTLVIVPTRELAVQIDQQIQGFAYFVPANSIAVYGGGDGGDFIDQKKAFVNHTEIIVATPGKLISHLNMGYVNFDDLKYLILDEADRMLDMGFFDDINKIISHTPESRQTLMFSATMPPKIRQLAKKILKNPVEINLGISKPAEGVLQASYLVYDKHKADLVGHLLSEKPDLHRVLVFASTKKAVGQIVRSLKKLRFDVAGISSDYDQKQREEVLAKFRAKKVRILVATDVLSRGIDIQDINLVINYDVPNDAEDYVHRVGRTARADKTGVALTFINPGEMYKFSRIESLIEREIIKLPTPAELGESPQWNSKSRKPAFKGRYKGKRR